MAKNFDLNIQSTLDHVMRAEDTFDNLQNASRFQIMADYNTSLKDVLGHEGGYSNDAGDPGGPTKYGITIFDVRMYVKKGATAADVKALTLDQAETIYKSKYWDAVKGDALPAGVDYAIFDYGVNSGISRAGKVLERLVGAPVDTGVIGPLTLDKTSRVDPVWLVNAICDERLKFLKGLHTWSIFGKGWNTRVAEVRRDALKMVSHEVPTTSTPPKPPTSTPVVNPPVQAPTRGLAGFLEQFFNIFSRKR